jgi:hypothetical protein
MIRGASGSISFLSVPMAFLVQSGKDKKGRTFAKYGKAKGVALR